MGFPTKWYETIFIFKPNLSTADLPTSNLPTSNLSTSNLSTSNLSNSDVRASARDASLMFVRHARGLSLLDTPPIPVL